MPRVKVVVPDAGPLFSFASIDALELLSKAGLPIVLTDYVEWEATKSGSETAERIRRWIRDEHEAVTVIPTETGAARIEAERKGVAKKRSHFGEITIQDAIADGTLGDGPYLFLFEEKRFIDPGFFGMHPVHSVTTLGFLVGLERSGLISDADLVFSKMRSNGREGVLAVILDRPYRADREAEDTVWRP